MQTNVFLKPRTIEQIDLRLEKLLKDLGNPKPPLRLPHVRELLKLDLKYYSSSDHSWLGEKLHQMKVAGKQIISEPTSILNVVKNLGLKGILLSDRRRILLDNEVPVLKHRWNEAHEITHDVLPWHDGIAHGDTESELSPACHEQIEAEANFGAGRLLFLGRQFEEIARSTSLTMASVKALKESYENTMTTCLWRLVELSLDASFGLISVHPRNATGALDDVRYFIRSSKFNAEYSTSTPGTLFAEVRRNCYGKRGPIGDGSFAVRDDRGEAYEFAFETFFNGHDALTIASCRAKLNT